MRLENAELIGRPLASGYGDGIALVFRADAVPEPELRKIQPPQTHAELERLNQAVRDAEYDLRTVEQRVRREVGEAEAHIVGAHRTLLMDHNFVASLTRHVEVDLMSAETAVLHATRALIARFEALDNDYLRERGRDVRDLQRRLLHQLGHGSSAGLEHLPPNTVLIARDLLPSDTLNLDRAHVSGLVLEGGGRTSHAAILARAMGIPAVGSIDSAPERILDGDSVLVDGERGTVIVNPSPLQGAGFAKLSRAFAQHVAQAIEDECQESTTLDGHHVTLLANIGRPVEVAQIQRHHLEGVGLFRSEYLFIQSSKPPSLAEQRNLLHGALQALGEVPFVVRTLDLGGDKQPHFPIDTFGGNLHFGMRGLRLSLNEQKLFRTQLRAILEVAQDRHNVSILLPMVVRAEDLVQAQEVIQAIAQEVSVPQLPRIGAMVETPSALFEIDEILELVDFVSVGTNDLVQFMLAIERRSVETLSQEAFFQPAVLRAVAHVLERASAHDKPATVCGEAAGDPVAARVLVGLGASRLSMSPVRAGPVRQSIRAATLTQLKREAADALAARTRDEVMAILTSVETLNG